MNHSISAILIVSSLAVTSLSVEGAGFRELQVSDPRHPDLTVGLWYPSDRPAPAEPNTEYGLAVALEAPMSGTNGGLILLSHGYGGWYAGHADTAIALADAGYIVVAPTHTGNTWSDMSSSVDEWLLDRPRHMSRVIDHVFDDEALMESVDPSRIGVYGFSAGGYTALNLIGGVPDLDRAYQHCNDAPEEVACEMGLIDAARAAGMHLLPNEAWGHDPRVTAAAMSAPGFGFAYTKASLSGVSADVQLWSGELDVDVPTETNAAWLAGQLPTAPETHWIEDASHFAFMVVPCRDAFKEADPEEYELICGDPEGFDRQAFHDDMHEEMIRFFDASFE